MDLVPKDKVKNWANIAKDIYPGIESKGEAEISAELVVKLENYKDKVIAVNPISFTTDKNFEFGFNKAFIEKKEVVGKNLHITFRMEWLDMPLDLTNKVEFWKKLNREFNGEMKSIDLWEGEETDAKGYVPIYLKVIKKGMIEEELILLDN